MNTQINNITAPDSAPLVWQKILKGENNGYWFTRETMRFFGSRILWATVTPLTDGRFAFLTREHSGFFDETPRYSVREWSLENGVDTLGDYNAYPSRVQAMKELKIAVKNDAKLFANVSDRGN
jgi:hypothetical protein